jgi:xylose isomerase
MANYFENIPQITYKGADSKDPFSFKYYDPDRVIMEKTMREHLPFAMAWWHNLGAAGIFAKHS